MKSFRELMLENLTYKFNPEDVLKFKGLENYVLIIKGSIMLYRDENSNENIFSIDTDKNKLTVLKQGWQLMNVKRGY